MPARRSRTDHWRDTLQQLHERNGSLELSLPGAQDRFPNPPLPGEESDIPANGDAAGEGRRGERAAKNLIWRVRVLQLTDDSIYVEQPVVLRQRIDLEPGIELVGVIVSGPNRWMFSTRNLGLELVRMAGGKELHAIRLQMPSSVERCQRRNFYRISTVGLLLPRAEVYPLLDPNTVAAAEAANRAEINDKLAGAGGATIAGRITPAGASASQFALPEVGPGFGALLVNLGGGGAGLLVEPLDGSNFDRHRLFWLRVHLAPHIPAPLGVTARAVHTHLDASQRTYVGMSFDFGFNRSHEQFVVNQLCRYVAEVQREQLRRQAAVG